MIDVIRYVATRPETDQMRIIGRRTDGNGFGCSTLQVAEVMGYFFEPICVKLSALLTLVQKYRVVSRFCLVRLLAIHDAWVNCEALLTVPLRGSCVTRKKSHPWVIVMPRSTTVPGLTLQLRLVLAVFLSVG